MAERPPKKNAPRAWQRMLSGRRLDLLDPSPFDIEIEDIAHGLARVARWNGQTIGEHAFSVAQHSVVVEEIAAHIKPGLDPKWRLAALLHDASEYVIGDMISPFKAALGSGYKDFEAKLEAAIHLRYGLPPKTPQTIKTLIKKADKACALRSNAVGRFHRKGIPGLLRQPARRLQPGDRAAARPCRPSALSGALSRPGRSGRPDRRR